MFQVGIKNSFRASHFLRGDFGPESLPHEHLYTVEWICSAQDLDQNGFSVDIALMEELLKQAVEAVQGRTLNDLEFFRQRQCSVENMARFFHNLLFDALEARAFSLSRIRRSEMKIWESESAWASYIVP